VIAAYLRRRGFVGVGRILEAARRIRDVEIDGRRLLDMSLKCSNMGENSGDALNSEYVALVDWRKAVPRAEAKWKRGHGLFTTTHVRASLDNQPTTIAFLDREFGVDVRSLIV
jgi:hypothetical protein